MIPHNRPTLEIEEETAAKRVISSGNLIQGKEVDLFENEFCDYLGIDRGHAVAVSSGSAALYLSLWSIDAEHRIVSFPGYVCSALHHSVKMIGGSERLFDVSPNSPNVDISKFNNNVENISIIPHMFGIPIDLERLSNTKLIEDCCQALGAKVNGKYVGMQGTLSVFSFYATKLITSGGQGGMIISEDKNRIESIRMYLDYDGMKHNQNRFNFQLTDLQAAIGRVQLQKLPTFLARREEIFQKYKESGLDLLDIDSSDSEKLSPVRYRVIMKTKNPAKVINVLKLAGVTALTPMEGWMEESIFPNAYNLTKEYVSIPIYPSLSDEEVEFIISTIKTDIQ